MSLITSQYIQQQVQLALTEDIGSGDVTASLVPDDKIITARIISRQSLVLCGTQWVDEVFRQLDSETQINWHYTDGDKIEVNQIICSITGPANKILTGERTALNFLQTLSATATTTSKYVAAVSRTDCKILDTRKTIPNLRLAQKYAVTCGGGQNHRIGLYDAILIKENHISAAGSIKNAVAKAKADYPDLFIEVEVETPDELKQAIDAGVDRALLDNMDIETLNESIRLNNHRIELEASGGVTLDNIDEIARTGVDYISVGSITKDIHAIDLSMLFDQD